MKVNKVKTTLLVGVIMTLFVASAMAVNPTKTDAIEPFFTLVFKTNGGGVRPDYGNFLKQHCARIGISIDVIVQDWPTFVGELIAFRDFDICYVGLCGGGADPDFTGVYDENGSLNLFGYHTSMDWDVDKGTGLNEWYMKQGTLIMPPDSEVRIQHYWAWQQYMMDKILPLVPTFSPLGYNAQWATLEGYNMSDGILQSWGLMDFTTTHTGQVSDDEFVFRDAAWSDLNPFFQDDTSSSFISSATMDPLIWYDEDSTVWPHLAESYVMLDDTTMRITVRQGIEWDDDPDGLSTDEVFDIDDVYFTLYSWAHVSNDQHLFAWIKDMVKIDQWTMDLYIDGDPSTPAADAYAPFLPSIATRMMPEYYLNQSQLADSVTPDVTHPSWNKFATNCFGTGLFEITGFTEGVETVLSVRDDCWRLDPVITADPLLDWANRFGFGSGWDGIGNMRIRIIPDQQTALLEFESGKLDLVGVGWNPDKRDEFMNDPDFTVQSDLPYCYYFYGFNMRPVRLIIGDRTPAPGDETISKGLAVRKAIAYAIDRIEMNNVIHRGESTIIDTPLYAKMGIWNNPNIIRYNFDIDKAREYMTKAGYDLGWTPTTPGFTMLIAFTSIMAIATITYLIVKKRK
ncbi:MAG: hypothetical protein E3J70_08080 [Candidatus Heimdallarchaeota archaeon]|nr:MAG: hypothetical protein E3J70_08080 [Candidatus Heimdallarchaeota archaeon]